MPDHTFAYVHFLYKPVPQGNWPHSRYCRLLHTWRRLRAPYVEESHYYVFEVYLASVCTKQVVLIYLELYISLGKLHVQLSNFG